MGHGLRCMLQRELGYSCLCLQQTPGTGLEGSRELHTFVTLDTSLMAGLRQSVPQAINKIWMLHSLYPCCLPLSLSVCTQICIHMPFGSGNTNHLYSMCTPQYVLDHTPVYSKIFKLPCHAHSMYTFLAHMTVSEAPWHILGLFFTYRNRDDKYHVNYSSITQVPNQQHSHYLQESYLKMLANNIIWMRLYTSVSASNIYNSVTVKVILGEIYLSVCVVLLNN